MQITGNCWKPREGKSSKYMSLTNQWVNCAWRSCYFAGHTGQANGFTKYRVPSGVELKGTLTYNFWHCENNTASITFGHFEYAAWRTQYPFTPRSVSILGILISNLKLRKEYLTPSLITLYSMWISFSQFQHALNTPWSGVHIGLSPEDQLD